MTIVIYKVFVGPSVMFFLSFHLRFFSFSLLKADHSLGNSWTLWNLKQMYFFPSDGDTTSTVLL